MTRESAGRSGEVVELAAVVAASPADVWRALTTPALLERWMGDFGFRSSWVVGGPFAVVGPLNGRAYEEAGTLLACEPPTLLRFDHWSRLWRIPDGPGGRAVMTIRCAAEGDGTRVSLTHALPLAEAIAPHSRFFWGVALERLRQLFAAGPRV